MRDHREPTEAQQVGAAVRVRVEPLAKVTRGRPDQEPPDLAARRRADLVPDPLEDGLDRALEQLQADVAREPVADDDVARLAEEVAALDVAAEAEVAPSEERVG